MAFANAALRVTMMTNFVIFRILEKSKSIRHVLLTTADLNQCIPVSRGAGGNANSIQLPAVTFIAQIVAWPPATLGRLAFFVTHCPFSL